MSKVVSDVTPVAAGQPSDGFESLTGINDGVLGTGYSTASELSFIALALILAYVAHSTIRYLLPGFRLVDSVAEVLGLRDR